MCNKNMVESAMLVDFFHSRHIFSCVDYLAKFLLLSILIERILKNTDIVGTDS